MSIDFSVHAPTPDHLRRAFVARPELGDIPTLAGDTILRLISALPSDPNTNHYGLYVTCNPGDDYLMVSISSGLDNQMASG